MTEINKYSGKNSAQKPFLGIVANNGYVESYDFETAQKFDFHHSYALSPLGQRYYDDDYTLRFVKYAGDNKYTLEGSPALDPFDKGFKQIRIFAQYCVNEGVSPDTFIAVADHALGTPYEGKVIGKLEDWA
ncbi:hypothetical protein ACPUYX_11240 [Desulfosporosinus sp. SYSU MS00001]|uniref:hypothetical protein n=1 Tax=Desulfosporosinus sp. SYSU MS00001 TaxID=3416284 RepID=UPI003CEF9240